MIAPALCSNYSFLYSNKTSRANTLPCLYSALSLFVPVTTRCLGNARSCYYRAHPNRRAARYDMLVGLGAPPHRVEPVISTVASVTSETEKSPWLCFRYSFHLILQRRKARGWEGGPDLSSRATARDLSVRQLQGLGDASATRALAYIAPNHIGALLGMTRVGVASRFSLLCAKKEPQS